MANNRGAWTSEEDHRLAQVIETQGPRRWKTIATKAELNRCGKSCRLRWMNYLRPNIKRGNISAQEEDLILRLHKLLGNRWSLIAGRLPGRTDNEIKNYWNSHLSKKGKQVHINKLSSSTKLCNSNTSKLVPKPCTRKESEPLMTASADQCNIVKCETDDKETGSCSNTKSIVLDQEQNGKGEQEDGGLNMEWVSQFLLDMDDQSWFMNYFT